MGRGVCPGEADVSRESVEQALRGHGAHLKPKSDSRLMHAIGKVLSVFGNKRFMESYWTTLFKTIYYPSRVSDPYRYDVVIEHECVHVAQWRKFNILFTISYLFIPLPMGLAWFRWRWEREAYLVNIAHAQDKLAAIESIVHNLWHEYLWTWPKKRMRKWFHKHALQESFDV